MAKTPRISEGQDLGSVLTEPLPQIRRGSGPIAAQPVKLVACEYCREVLSIPLEIYNRVIAARQDKELAREVGGRQYNGFYVSPECLSFYCDKDDFNAFTGD